MPQPLERVRPSAGYTMCNAGCRPLRHNPELGLLAMEAIISWSNVERFLLSTYVELLGGPKDIAAIAYLALTNQNAKTQVIKQVSGHRLSPGNGAILNAILQRAKSSQGFRDKLAHWTWGFSPEIHDAYLLADPRVFREPGGTDGIYVFKEKDFSNAIAENDRICSWGLRFQFILEEHVGNRDGQLSRELWSELALPEKPDLPAPQG